MGARGPKAKPATERFWKLVEKTDGCWNWIGRRDEKGYGRFNVAYGVLVKASRYSYALVHGAIPAGMCVCHRCDNPPCVNPDHLWLGTWADNNRDMVAKGRNRAVPRQLLCIRGHVRVSENLYFTRDGRRLCKQCVKIRRQRQLARHRDHAVA